MWEFAKPGLPREQECRFWQEVRHLDSPSGGIYRAA